MRLLKLLEQYINPELTNQNKITKNGVKIKFNKEELNNN